VVVVLYGMTIVDVLVIDAVSHEVSVWGMIVVCVYDTVSVTSNGHQVVESTIVVVVGTMMESVVGTRMLVEKVVGTVTKVVWNRVSYFVVVTFLCSNSTTRLLLVFAEELLVDLELDFVELDLVDLVDDAGTEFTDLKDELFAVVGTVLMVFPTTSNGITCGKALTTAHKLMSQTCKSIACKVDRMFNTLTVQTPSGG